MSQENSSMPSPSNAANGLSKRSKRKGSDESHGSQGSLQFGKLTRRLNSEIQALSPAHTALSNISTLFREYRSEVEVFESNFDTMKAKDDQIRDLNTAMRIWKSTSNEEVEKLRSELESMEEGRKRLREEKQQFATTRDSKMQELEQNEKKLVDMEYRLKDGYEQQLKKAKDALKAETRETITQLQAANEKMTREVANLKIELAGAHDTIANERQDWYILRSELKKEKQALCEELESLKSDFAMEARPDDFYTQRFVTIQEDIKETSSRFFKNLPEDSLSKRKIFESRTKSCEIAEFAFLSDSLVSISLRLLAVEFLVVDILCRLIWQPFAPGIRADETTSADHFEMLSQELTRHGTHAESTWRALTVYGLRAPTAEREALERAIRCMLELLAPFTDDPGNSELSKALTAIIHKAMDVWDISRRDVRQIFIHSSPNPDDEAGWMHDDGDLFEGSDNNMNVDGTTMRSMSPICIFPKIVRGENPPKTIFLGRALFEESRLLALGRKESLDLQQIMSDAQLRFASQRGGESALRNRADRRSSIAAQMTPVHGT